MANPDMFQHGACVFEGLSAPNRDAITTQELLHSSAKHAPFLVVEAFWFCNLISDREDRIERRQWVLRYEPD
jgi:hypothetical protein